MKYGVQTQDTMSLFSSRKCIKYHVMIAIIVKNIGNALYQKYTQQDIVRER